jgi:hypothetical protein
VAEAEALVIQPQPQVWVETVDYTVLVVVVDVMVALVHLA